MLLRFDLHLNRIIKIQTFKVQHCNVNKQIQLTYGNGRRRSYAIGISFEIHYDGNPDGMYFTGQVVKGRAVINLVDPIPVKGVKLTVRGYSAVRWDEEITKTKPDGSTFITSEIHSDEEQYFDTTTECINAQGTEYTMAPGSHTFKFECPLPLQCPTSFESTYGRIRYETKITVARPRKFNKSYSMGFNVLKIVDLNNFPDLRIPAQMEMFKTFCCGPCKSRTLVLSLEIPRTGYVPGEFIKINARLVNHSTTSVEKVRMAINLIAFYSVSNLVITKTEKIALAKSKFGRSDKSVLELKDKIQVPPTPPTCENLCRIIKIKYEVEVTAFIKGIHPNPAVSIPITIGNIPYVERSARISEDTLIANLRNGALSGRQRRNTELAPPSYQEVMFVQPLHPTFPLKDEENTDTKFEKYAPRYPFYAVQLPQTSSRKS